MSTVKTLLQEIDAFLAERGVAETTFGRHAANDGKFVRRLRGGAGLTVATVDRVRAYMAAERAKRQVSQPALTGEGSATVRADTFPAPKAA